MSPVSEKEGVKELQAVVDRMNGTIAKLKARGALQSEICFWEAQRNYYQRAHEANVAGDPLFLTGYFIPQELLHAMEIAILSAENHGIQSVQSVPFEEAEPLFDAAEGYGMSSEVCSPHRAAMGLALARVMPRPTATLATATTCDQTLKLYEVLANYYKIPSFSLDSPYRIDQRSIDYAKEDVKAMIRFAEEHSGRKLDWDRLREVLRLSRQTYDYWEKICEMRKAVPCPTGGRASVKDFAILLSNCGRIEALNYYQARYEEMKGVLDAGRGVIPEERHRVAWLYVLPLFDLRIADWLEQEHQAVVVMDTFGYANPGIELDPEDPLDFLAKKALKWGFIQQTYAPNAESGFAQMMARQCVDYKADVAVVLAHWSCNQYCGTIRLLKDAVSEKLGIPFLVLDGDILDPRVVSAAQMRAKFDEFFAMVEGQR